MRLRSFPRERRYYQSYSKPNNEPRYGRCQQKFQLDGPRAIEWRTTEETFGYLCFWDGRIRGELNFLLHIRAWCLMLYGVKIYTNKDPFHYITTHSDFLRRVLDANEKPKKPGEDEAPKMEDDIWELAQGCWVKEPRLRPTAPCLCENISQIVGSRQSKCY
jgi:hypothetical protein